MLADKIYTNVRSGDLRRPLEYVVQLTGIAIIYIGLAKLSLALASIHPSATPIWPPTGYALGAVLLLGYQVSPAIFLGALVANATTAGSISTALAIAAGNTLESLIGAYFINRWSDGRSTFDTPAGVARFGLILWGPGGVSILFDLRGNDCSRSSRFQPAAGAESHPKFIGFFSNSAPDVGCIATQSARYGHHCAPSLMLCSVGYGVECGAVC